MWFGSDVARFGWGSKAWAEDDAEELYVLTALDDFFECAGGINRRWRTVSGIEIEATSEMMLGSGSGGYKGSGGPSLPSPLWFQGKQAMERLK